MAKPDAEKPDGLADEPNAEETVESLKAKLDATEKRRRDQDETVRRSMAEAKQAREEADLLRNQSKLTAAVDRLATSGSAEATAADQKARFEQARTDLAEAIGKGDVEGAERFLSYMQAYGTDAETRATAKAEARMKEMRDELMAEITGLKQRQSDQDPDYVPHRERINELAEKYGLDPKNEKDRRTLLAFAKDTAKTEHPARELPGGGGGGSGRVANGGAGDVMSFDEMNALAKSSGLREMTREEYTAQFSGRK